MPKPAPLVWSEEDQAFLPVEPAPPRTGARSLATSLRHTLAAANFSTAHPHERTRGAVPAIIYAPTPATHGNFIDLSYRRILAHPAWSKRLEKAHTAKRQARPTGADEQTRAWCELDSASSSDALLMNIFCYPRVLATPRLPALLGIPPGLEPEFGFIPSIPRLRNLKDRTEIDLRLGSLLIEAKLTESDFQYAPLRLLERYPDFAELFDGEALELTSRGIRSYQLIRGVLAAHAQSASFCVLLDQRRPDLVEAWYGILRAVRPYELRARLRLLTWQEVAAVLPHALRRFLHEKYGIAPAP